MVWRLFDRFLWVLAAVSAGILGSIAVVIAINVVLRSIGVQGIYGTLDAIQYALMIATFMGAPWVLLNNGHVRVDLIAGNLEPRQERALAVLTNMIGALTAAVLAWYGVQAVLASAGRGSMIRTSFVIPEWLMLAFVPLSMGLCCVVFLRNIFRGVRSPNDLSGL